VLHKKDYSALKNNLSSAFEEVTRMAIMPTSGLIEKVINLLLNTSLINLDIE
jgi:hypothetical protein